MEPVSSPDIFKQWAGISCIAGALERRVWATTRVGVVFPNLYVLLVSPPGVGKTQIITPVENLWRKTRTLKVAPNSVTKASLVDAIAAAMRKIVLSPQEMVEFNSLCVAAGEFGVLVPAHDTEFLSVLNYIYDNPPMYEETRRTLREPIEIMKPQLNILAGAQPAFLANLLPEEAWGMGFMSRQIMIYSSQVQQIDLFDLTEIKGAESLAKNIVEDLKLMVKLYGEIKWEARAQAELSRWYSEGMPPRPEHSKMVHYNSRRILHIIKLCIVSSVSRGQDFLITHYDVNRAREWLLEAERVMPDVFKEMVSRSDSQVIQELHYFAYRIWAKDQKPIHEARLIHFLQHRVPSDRVQKVLEISERANIIARLAGTTTYVPKPKNEHGVE